MTHSLTLACLVALAAFLSLTACGVDGSPTAPNGTKPQFPTEQQLDINR